MTATLLALALAAAPPRGPGEARRPAGEAELRFWLTSMVAHHRYRVEEVVAATGLSRAEVAAALRRWDIRPGGRGPRRPGEPLVVLPYPGGRHPRIGFLDGAVRP